MESASSIPDEELSRVWNSGVEGRMRAKRPNAKGGVSVMKTGQDVRGSFTKKSSGESK